MEGKSFAVRWKGKPLGQFTRAEMIQKIEQRAWSTLHEVETSSGWTPIGDFLKATEPSPEVEGPLDFSDDEVAPAWIWGGYLCAAVLALLATFNLISPTGSHLDLTTFASVLLGLAGSFLGLTAFGRGFWKHGVWQVGLCVVLALAAMALAGRH
jgi:hypothetical protein